MPTFDLDAMVRMIVAYRSNNTEVLFNDDDYITGDPRLTYDAVTGILSFTPDSATFDGLNLESGVTYAPWMKFHNDQTLAQFDGIRFHEYAANPSGDYNCWISALFGNFMISAFTGDASAFGYDPSFSYPFLQGGDSGGGVITITLGYDANTLGYLTGLWAARREGADGVVTDIFSLTDTHLPTVPEGSEVAFPFNFNTVAGYQVTGARIAVGQEVTDNWDSSAGINESAYLSLKTLFENTVTERLRITGYGDVILGTSYPNQTGIYWDFYTEAEVNKVVNGTFDSSASWTWGTGWSWVSAYANHGTNGTGLLEQDISVEVDKSYVLIYTVSSRTVGSVTPTCGGTVLTTRSANGTYIESFIAATTGTLQFLCTNTARLRVDTVSVIDVSTPMTGWTLGVGWGHRFSYPTDHYAYRTADGTGIIMNTNFVCPPGQTWIVYHKWVDITADTVTISMGGDAGQVISADGIYQNIFQSVDGSPLIFTPDNTFRGKLCFCIAIRVLPTGNIVCNDLMAAGKVGFCGATPKVQAEHIDYPADLPSCITAITSIIDLLEDIGLTATS